MTNELEPCPFCNGSAHTRCWPAYDGYYHANVMCDECGACSGICSHGDVDVAILMAKACWNTRYKRTCKNIAQWKDGDFKCSLCTAELEYAPTKPFGKHETDETVRVNCCPCCRAEVLDD